MLSVDLDPVSLVDVLRSEGSDVTDIEAKRATDGYPSNLAPTLSAFGNMPGGGVIVLGLDEHDSFAATGVRDPVDLKTRLAAQARTAVEPPLQVMFETAEVDGASIVVARVHELTTMHKPCVVRSSGLAYLRSYDGDYPLSEQEMATFVAQRGTPRDDRDPVPGTSRDDLDAVLTATYLAGVRARSPRLAPLNDDDILRHTRILTPHGLLTVAGLYTLGSYPQTHIPSLAVTARVAPRPGDPPGTRSSDIGHFDGPLPELLDQVVAWVRRNTATRIRFGVDGHGRDEPSYPTEAVRELVANALVHRDLGAHALGSRVNLVLESDRLVITNPGGLFGLTTAQLGVRVGGSARNQSLYDIAKDVRTVDGRRVVEGLGTGIIAATDALEASGMTPPYFLDAGVRFTAIIPQDALLDADDLAWLADLSRITGTTAAQRHALVAMRHGAELTNRTYRQRFPMDSTRARSELVDLVARGLAQAVGERGARSYRLSGPKSTVDELVLFPTTATPVIDPAPPATHGRSGLPVARSSSRDQVLGALADGPATASDLVAHTGLSRRQVTHALTQLRDAGRVSRTGGPGIRDTRYEAVTT